MDTDALNRMRAKTMTTEPTSFQRQWIIISKRLGLDIQLSHQIDIGERKLTAPVRLLGFGADHGMLLSTNYELVRDVAAQIVNLGYGYSCLSEPLPGPIDWEYVEAMLRDWGSTA